AHELGLRAALVAARDDADSLAASIADDVVILDGETLRESYLDGAKIVAAAKRTGATLVHPGFGFLAEDSSFARRLTGAGLVWVGPKPESMEAVGSKLGAKRLAEKLSVPTAPWALLPATAKATELRAAAATVGFPCLVKASAGGGGKGMKNVETES